MAYTVLARRYRSGTFDEVIGQDHVSQTLKKAIASDRIAHAFLFTGTRGVGKTSMARIMAKALNCLSADKPTTEPCGKCSSCEAVARGEDIDVIEIDAASNTGVDNVRDIIENARFRPARARFKVYIIDEVHMLSKAAFNALLKIMEEPPSHVKFILATTEAEKVLPTILSRCQRYDFRNIPSAEIVKHLRRICDDEKIDAQDAALAMVARAGAGSMRDSLSVLDRLLSVGEKTLDVSSIEQVLGVPRAQAIFDLADAIGRADVAQTLTLANGIVDGGLGVDTLIASLIEHLHRLLVVRTCGIKSSLVDAVGFDTNELERQASRFDPALLTQDIAILEDLRRQMRSSQASRAILDATLVRLALAEQFVDVDEVAAEGSAAQDQKKKADIGSVVPAPRPESRPTPPQPTAAKAVEPTPASPPPKPAPAPVERSSPIPATSAKPPGSSKAAEILAQVSRDMPIAVHAPAPAAEPRRPRAIRPDLETVAKDVVVQPVGLVDETLRDDALVKAVLEKFDGAKLVAD